MSKSVSVCLEEEMLSESHKRSVIERLSIRSKCVLFFDQRLMVTHSLDHRHPFRRIQLRLSSSATAARKRRQKEGQTRKQLEQQLQKVATDSLVSRRFLKKKKKRGRVLGKQFATTVEGESKRDKRSESRKEEQGSSSGGKRTNNVTRLLDLF